MNKPDHGVAAIQRLAFGGIANPTQRAVLRGSDATYLTARQRELDAFEEQRQSYNTALQDFQTNVYEPYKAKSAAYNTAAEKYNTDVYNPYKTQFDAYTKAVEEYNAGPRTADYAGPAAPTLASEFTMTAPTSPTAFAKEAPVLPFEVTDVETHQKAAAKRAVQDASDRAVAIDVVSDPGRFNFGSMSVSDRFMAEGGEVERVMPQTARAMLAQVPSTDPNDPSFVGPRAPPKQVLSDAIAELKKGNKSQAEAIMREIVGLPPLRTEAPKTAVTPVAAPGSAASDLKKITAAAPPATGSSIPPPPSGDIVPPVPHPDGNTYGSPGSSDGKWFYTDGKWFPNEKVYGGPAVFPDSGPQPVQPVVPQPPRPLEPGPQPVQPVVPQPVRPIETQPVFRQPNDKGMGPKQPPVLPPTPPPYTPVRPPPVIAEPRVGKKGAATSPSSYFALTPQTSTGLAPGTAAIGPADMPLYGAKNTMSALGANPNLSPGMLGGQQNAGMFADRLGNRIYSPTAMPVYSFAKGGDIDLKALLAQNTETLSDDTPEEVINTDPLGTAQKMMADFSSVSQTNPNVSPVRKAIKRTKPEPAKSGSAKMAYESLVKGDLGAMGTSPPKLQDTDSAQAQMRELARIYQLKAQASQDRARGLSADTFGAPTLGQPTLTKGKLTKRRFNKGGEAKKPEGDEAEPLRSPEEQPVTEESSASRALGAFISRLKEGAQGYLGLDPGISGSDSYRTGQALSNMPGVGAPAAVAGIFIGKGAKGWNAVSNALAKKAAKQGASPEEVWKTTGNFKAPDGQWRQEISDATAQMRESIFQGPANRILSHPELFANYPDLGRIMTSKDPYTTKSGLFSGAAGPDALIRLGTAGGKNENAKGMLHELQHAIQFKEGFGQGGSKDMAFTDPKAFEILQRIRTNVARPISIEDYAKEAWQSSNVTPEIAAMYQKYLDYHKKSLKTMDIEAQKTAGREYYNRLLGEVEARAVEGRKSYTMDERLQLIPSQSYRINGGRDIIPLDQLIVKRAGGSPEEGETSIKDQLIGAGETALTLGSGALSSVVGMPYGLYKGLTSGKYLEGKAPAIAEKEAQAFIERNTYVPRSTKGRENLEELNRLMEQSKLPPILPETMMLRSIPRAAVAAQGERIGMATEKALEKPVTEVLKRGGKSAEMLKALSAPPSYVSRAPGGYFPTSRANEGGILSNLDKAFDPILKEAKLVEDPEKREALSTLFNQKAKDFYTKQAGSIEDPLRKDILAGALKFERSTPMGDAFPQVLLKGAAQGDLESLRLLEKNYDQMLGIRSVVPRRTGTPAVEGVVRSQIMTNIRDNLDKIPDAQLVAYSGRKPGQGPTAMADLATEIRKKVKDNPTLFSIILEPRIAETLFNKSQNSTDVDIARFPSAYGTASTEAMVANPSALKPDYNDPMPPNYFLPELEMAIEKGQPIQDLGSSSIRLLGMTPENMLEQARQMPAQDLNRMGFADFLKKAYVGTQKVDAFKAALPKVKKLIQDGKPPPADIMTYGVEDFLPTTNNFRWVKVVKPEAVRAIAVGMNNSVAGYATSDTYGSLRKGRTALNSGEAEVYALYDKNNVPHVTIEYLTNKEGVPDGMKNTIAQLTGNGPLSVNALPKDYTPQIVDFMNNVKPSSIPRNIKNLLEDTGQKKALNEEVLSLVYFGVPIEALRGGDDNLLQQLGAVVNNPPRQPGAADNNAPAAGLLRRLFPGVAPRPPRRRPFI